MLSLCLTDFSRPGIRTWRFQVLRALKSDICGIRTTILPCTCHRDALLLFSTTCVGLSSVSSQQRRRAIGAGPRGRFVLSAEQPGGEAAAGKEREKQGERTEPVARRPSGGRTTGDEDVFQMCMLVADDLGVEVRQ